MKQEIQKKPKLVSVKFKPELYDKVVKFAAEEGIESVSTFVRSVVVRYMNAKERSEPAQIHTI